MTNHEAIETLKANYPDACFEQLREAVDTAISALQAQDVPDRNVGDTISRQAAIDALGEEPEVRSDNDQYDQYDLGLNNQWWDDVNAIKALPSAQRKGKWIRNNDSDHAWKCSVCGCGYTDYRLNYCYDCGAEMEKDGKRDCGG